LLTSSGEILNLDFDGPGRACGRYPAKRRIAALVTETFETNGGGAIDGAAGVITTGLLEAAGLLAVSS
jgi:hypothetical protein